MPTLGVDPVKSNFNSKLCTQKMLTFAEDSPKQVRAEKQAKNMIQSQEAPLFLKGLMSSLCSTYSKDKVSANRQLCWFWPG